MRNKMISQKINYLKKDRKNLLNNIKASTNHQKIETIKRNIFNTKALLKERLYKNKISNIEEIIYQRKIMLENAGKIEDSIAIYELNSVKLRTNVKKKIIAIKSVKLKQTQQTKTLSIYQQLH